MQRSKSSLELAQLMAKDPVITLELHLYSFSTLELDHSTKRHEWYARALEGGRQMVRHSRSGNVNV